MFEPLRRSDRRWPKEISRILWRKLECPTCTSIEFHDSPHRLLDGFFALIRFMPLQCSNCWRCYYWRGRISPAGR